MRSHDAKVFTFDWNRHNSRAHIVYHLYSFQRDWELSNVLLPMYSRSGCSVPCHRMPKCRSQIARKRRESTCAHHGISNTSYHISLGACSVPASRISLLRRHYQTLKLTGIRSKPELKCPIIGLHQWSAPVVDTGT